jgi:hypothetical protein
MLTLALISSIAFTAYCIWAGAHPPSLQVAKVVSPATAVIVEMLEESPPDDDLDPPTVVQTRP